MIMKSCLKRIIIGRFPLSSQWIIFERNRFFFSFEDDFFNYDDYIGFFNSEGFVLNRFFCCKIKKFFFKI